MDQYEVLLFDDDPNSPRPGPRWYVIPVFGGALLLVGAALWYRGTASALTPVSHTAQLQPLKAQQRIATVPPMGAVLPNAGATSVAQRSTAALPTAVDPPAASVRAVSRASTTHPPLTWTSLALAVSLALASLGYAIVRRAIAPRRVAMAFTTGVPSPPLESEGSTAAADPAFADCGRVACELAAQGRITEAHLHIAASPLSEAARTMLHKQCADATLECDTFAEGLVVKPTSEGRWGVFATRDFKSQDCILQEMAVVPWSWFDFSDPERLEALIAELRTEEGRAKTARLNGMVPRSVPEIPHAVPILRELEGNVRATHPDLEGEELQELMRVLAVVVLNAHEDGCHGFGSLFNSHCTPNVEVRGWIHMDVYCLRDIAAGEELCISYRAHGELDMAVDWRRFRFAQKWGELCTCPRCQRELRELGVEDPDDVAATEVRASAVLEWYNGELCPIIDRIGGDRLPLDDPAVVDLLEGRSLDWRGTKWKELAVLEWFSGYVPVALGLHRKPKKATLAQVLGWLADLYALRLEVTEEWSLALANTRAILVAVLKLCIKASVTIPRPGYASVAELKATDRELRRINKKVSL